VIPAGRAFYKMSGSGNDFVMIDARAEPRGRLDQPQVIQSICARRTGVGADGIVFLETSDCADVRLTYLNADGSRADFCGNATLCTTRLATELGVAASASDLTIETDSGIVTARIRGGMPEIDLPPVTNVLVDAPGVDRSVREQRIGFALVGVPHLVILCDDVATVDVVGRGRPLRSDPSLAQGANVNFVSAGKGGWRYRTYERGVEAETLACGSGAVATAILLASWGLAMPAVQLQTRSGRPVSVDFNETGEGWMPRLSGEGRVVYIGSLSEI
jgi:diaminopimelate epimerase